MKTILTGILSFLIFFGAVPSVQAAVPICEMSCCEMAYADEDIKKKKKKKKKVSSQRSLEVSNLQEIKKGNV